MTIHGARANLSLSRGSRRRDPGRPGLIFNFQDAVIRVSLGVGMVSRSLPHSALSIQHSVTNTEQLALGNWPGGEIAGATRES